MVALHQEGDIIAERYRILDTLGQGSCGITYKAEDLQSQQQVAVKALSLSHLQDWKQLDLFEREAQILQQLNHPAIPHYLDYFQVDTREEKAFYIVQQLVEGKSLATMVQEMGWRTNESGVRLIAIQVLEILVYLQSLKPPVVHRDIKPQNLICGENGKIFLVDFGAVADAYCSTVGKGSTIVGTYGYMAPEQFQGQAVPATDLYGLAATVLFLLTHRNPADLPLERLKISFRSRIQVSEGLADWLEKMLEPDVKERFSSAEEALKVLQGRKVGVRESSKETLHQPGDIIAKRYRILDTLGEGGIGISYLAEDLQTGQRVALKAVLLQRMDDSKIIELFEREARILAQLNHPNIPRYLDYFQEGKRRRRCFYLAQQLARGQSLATLIEKGWQPDEAEVRRIASKILEILVYLQQLTPPVIHRDIKPHNIIRRSDGQVFLVDFGAVQDVYHNTLTGGSTVVGTYGYMAPEQFRGQAVLATDLYGLGATLIFLLTRKAPVDLPQRKLKIDFRSHMQINQQFSDWLERMIEPMAEDRFLSAREALTCFQTKKTQTISAETTRPKTPGRAIKFNRSLIVAACLVTLSILIGASMTLILNQLPSAFALLQDKVSQKQDNRTFPSLVKSSLPFPVASWDFNECGGAGQSLLASQLVNTANGTTVRNVTCGKGKFRYAAWFNGVDSLIEIPDQPSFNFTNQMSVSAWVNPSRLSGLQTIVNKWYAMDSYMLVIDNGNYIFVVAFPGGEWGTPIKVSAPATLGFWTHLAGVFDGQKLLLYVNGQLAATTVARGTLQASDRPISIGNHPSWNAFQGGIDQVRLYNVALDAQQIQQLSSAP